MVILLISPFSLIKEINLSIILINLSLIFVSLSLTRTRLFFLKIIDLKLLIFSFFLSSLISILNLIIIFFFKEARFLRVKIIGLIISLLILILILEIIIVFLIKERFLID